MAEITRTPSREAPVAGGCLCGAVRFEVSGPALSSGYCHCKHCQRRTGTAASANCRVARGDFRLLSGSQHLRAYTPAAGAPKAFCVVCGSSLFSGDPLCDDQVAIRLGAFDEDPGIRPQYRQYVASAAGWETIPEDGLPRYAGPRTS